METSVAEKLKEKLAGNAQPQLKVINARCMGCEMCARVCAQIRGLEKHTFTSNKPGWNIILKNGKATILDLALCQHLLPTCNMACLEHCPTKALCAEFIRQEKETN